MSAYIVSDEEINALATAYYLTVDKRITEQEVAGILLAENFRSVNYRYREDEEPPAIRFRVTGLNISPVQILKMCSHFDYQACETSDYRETRAAKIVDEIRYAAIERLPGYGAASWGL